MALSPRIPFCEAHPHSPCARTAELFHIGRNLMLCSACAQSFYSKESAVLMPVLHNRPGTSAMLCRVNGCHAPVKRQLLNSNQYVCEHHAAGIPLVVFAADMASLPPV